MTIREMVEEIYVDWYNNQCVDFKMGDTAIKGKIVEIKWADNTIENRLKIKLESGAEYNIDKKGFKALRQFRRSGSGAFIGCFKDRRKSAQGKAKKKLVEPACAFAGSLF